MENTTEVKRKDLHNLKSGLTAVMGYIQLAQSKLVKLESEDSVKINELLVKAIESSNSLEKQIRELEEVNEPLIDL